MNEAAVYEKVQELLRGIGEEVVNTQEFLKQRCSNERQKLMQRAIETFGIDAQMGIAQEECAELIQAISKFNRGKVGSTEKVCEEIADVQIMLDQMKIMFGNTSAIEQRKLERLKARLEAE